MIAARSSGISGRVWAMGFGNDSPELVEALKRPSAAVGQPSGQRFVGENTEGIDIGAGVGGLRVACSGGMYSRRPTRSSSFCSVTSRAFAIPKSVIFTTPS